MFATIKGHYEKGQIFLDEEPPVDSKTEVIITFLVEDDEKKAKRLRLPGGLKGKVAIPEDFNAPLDDLKDYM